MHATQVTAELTTRRVIFTRGILHEDITALNNNENVEIDIVNELWK